MILDVSGFKTVTIRSGVKNPIQRTTFYLQRRSGAGVMTWFVFAKRFFLKNNGLSFFVWVREAFFSLLFLENRDFQIFE